MTNYRYVFLSAAVVSLFGLQAVARAHVSVAGVGMAGTNQVIDFRVGHGCEGADTVELEVRLPAEVTSVRAMPWAFGSAEVVYDDAELPIAVLWKKENVTSVDDQYYSVSVRIAVPDAPFTTLRFPTVQTCRSPEGLTTEVEWVGAPGDEAEPAPELLILPKRYPGWNRVQVPSLLEDLSVFDDAQIVWHGERAHSSNPAIAERIASEEGVEVLTSIPAGAEIWVKY